MEKNQQEPPQETTCPTAGRCSHKARMLLSVSCLLLAAFATTLSVYLIRRDEVHQAARTETLTRKTTALRAVQEDPYQDVIIIGAGWAGLAAMDVLTRNGISNARILEARDYVGGRSHTVRDFVPGLPVELGSAWIYQDTALIDREEELKISYAVSNSGSDAFGLYETPTLRGESENSKLSNSEKQALFGKVWSGDNGFVPFGRKEVDDMREDVDFEQVVDEFLEEDGSDLTQEDKQFLHAMTHSEIGSEFAAPFNELSAQEAAYALDESDDESEDESEGSHYLGVPGGGYDSMINDLAVSFMNRIELNARVASVQYGEEGELARVTYVDESGTTRTVTTSAVLVTVPLGVLKASDIEFVPGLPREKLNAINSIGYGNVNKCIMYWEDTEQAATWWPTDQVWLGLVTDEDETSGVWTEFLNDMAQGNGGNPVLVGWISGDDADAMEGQTDEQVLEAVLSNLRTMLGGSNNVPKPTKYMVTRWRQDEFSRGAYSFPYPGSDGSWQKALRRPVGNLFFAGEATDEEWYATTAGAYNSGVEAGEEIADSLR